MMYKYFAILLAAASVASCATREDVGARFGVVAQTADRVLCAVFPSSATVGERVKIVAFGPERQLDARLARKVAACGVGLDPGYAYELELAEPQEGLVSSIAVRGRLPAHTSFRRCSGTESIHLAAWLGGRRVWSGYYYPGYDVEPDCKASDIE